MGIGCLGSVFLTTMQQSPQWPCYGASFLHT